MVSTVLSGGLRGIYCYPVKVEVDISNGLPGFEMVGFLSGEVREAKERVKVSLKNAGYPIPAVKVTVNLSPADIRKEGTAYDLPIAIGILKSLGCLTEAIVDEFFYVGELGLNGEIRPVPGVLPMVLEMKKRGIRKCMVPGDNVAEGAVVEGVQVYGVTHISEVVEFLKNPEKSQVKPEKISLEELFKTGKKKEDFSDVQGQEMVRRAAEISAAGFHHLLMVGPPGSGKTMIARRMPTIMPPMNSRESLEVSAIYSVGGLLKKGQSLITERPFLAPHHTITPSALAGGGNVPRPGVISRAHRGVMFLDELAEFKRDTIEILRQPLEDKKVQIARQNGTVTYPADFLVVAAMNPCPCGYYPDPNLCSCTSVQIARYLGKISGPILDRMDLVATVRKMDVSRLEKGEPGESSESMAERIRRAREMQEKRFRGTDISFNAEMKIPQIKQFCNLDEEGKRLLRKICESTELSARAYYKMLKVARTIADLDGCENIQPGHLAEAACFRKMPGRREATYYVGE